MIRAARLGNAPSIYCPPLAEVVQGTGGGYIFKLPNLSPSAIANRISCRVAIYLLHCFRSPCLQTRQSRAPKGTRYEYQHMIYLTRPL